MEIPALGIVAAALLLALLVECGFRYREAWALPAALIYLTVFAWYFADLYITPENYAFLPTNLLELSYTQVIIFLVCYRLFARRLTIWLSRHAENPVRRVRPISAELMFAAAIILWGALLTYGVTRMHGNVIGALFPIQGRTGRTMWFRLAASDAGSTGFIVSTAAYFYVLACASFGVLFFFVRSNITRVLTAAMMAISWPYFLLSGTRSTFLAVSVPFFFGYLMFGKQRFALRIAVIALAFLMINTAMLVVIKYRGRGFEEYLAENQFETEDDEEVRQRGLNMIQELCFVNIYMTGAQPAWGTRYLEEIENVIPRAIWANKPMIRIDYAVFRGFAGGRSDIGVVATISTGMIGGGILNFGKWLGPIAPALLMALWTALLGRWWVQRASLLRCLLFLFGMGLTFNLGRDITLLTLWPIVFAYVVIRAVEWWRRVPAREAAVLIHERSDALVAMGHGGGMVRW